MVISDDDVEELLILYHGEFGRLIELLEYHELAINQLGKDIGFIKKRLNSDARKSIKIPKRKQTH